MRTKDEVSQLADVAGELGAELARWGARAESLGYMAGLEDALRFATGATPLPAGLSVHVAKGREALATMDPEQLSILAGLPALAAWLESHP